MFVPTGRCYSAERARLRVLLVGPPPEQREGRDPGAGCSDEMTLTNSRSHAVSLPLRFLMIWVTRHVTRSFAAFAAVSKKPEKTRWGDTGGVYHRIDHPHGKVTGRGREIEGVVSCVPSVWRVVSPKSKADCGDRGDERSESLRKKISLRLSDANANRQTAVSPSHTAFFFFGRKEIHPETNGAVLLYIHICCVHNIYMPLTLALFYGQLVSVAEVPFLKTSRVAND